MGNGRCLKVVVYNGDGGVMQEFVARWTIIGLQGNQVEVLVPCYSACTFVVAYVPKERLCFGKDAGKPIELIESGKAR
jgi:hypothetical protein